MLDYFTRFRLCPTLQFGLEIYAPTLSSTPTFVRPRKAGEATVPTNSHRKPIAKNATSTASIPEHNQLDLDIEQWKDPLSDESDKGDQASDHDDGDDDSGGLPRSLNKNKKMDPKLVDVFEAAKSFWPNKRIELKNVARSLQKIRVSRNETNSQNTTDPSDLHLEVNVIVCPGSSNYDDEEDDDDDSSEEESLSNGRNRVASIKLIRMVNDVPLLDGAEAHSCGLVHGLINKTLWGSFGLDVSRKVSQTRVIDWTPTFNVRDSDQVSPFFQTESNHKQLLSDSQQADDDNSKSENDDQKIEDRKRKWDTKEEKNLLPCSIRLGAILICVNLRAAPSSLPLPTLSKVSQFLTIEIELCILV